MNRQNDFNYIEMKLNELSQRIQTRGSLNLLDLNIHAETFFYKFLNIVYGYTLRNINTIRQNADAIDLVDTNNKIVIQVSSTRTKKKIQESLNKLSEDEYSGYTFQFLPLHGDASSLRKNQYIKFDWINFNPEVDIYDLKMILRHITDCDMHKIRGIYNFIQGELETEIDPVKIDSLITDIINILSKENLNNPTESNSVKKFVISNKIDANDLTLVSNIIYEHKAHYIKVNEKYEEFDKQGSNVTLSVLNAISKQYYDLSVLPEMSSSQIFLQIIDNISDIVINSKNYTDTATELVGLCVSILVVDAFIKCKIFKNPEGYAHVTTK